MDSVTSFKINITGDPTKPKKVKSEVDLSDEGFEKLFKDLNLNIGFQIYHGDDFIKTDTLENLKEKLFFEKNNEALSWNISMQEKVNFIVNIFADLIGMFSRVLFELIPKKVETFQERFLTLMDAREKEYYRDQIKVFIEAQKSLYPQFQYTLREFFETVSYKMDNIKAFLEEEIGRWKNSVHIASVFMKGKKKIKNALKSSKVEEGIIESMMKQFVQSNIKTMERIISDINSRNAMLLWFRDAFKEEKK